MKLRTAIAVSLLGFVVPGRAEEGVLPTAFPVSRYTEIWENSPFNREVVPAVVQTIQSSFAQSLVLEGIVSDDTRGTIAYVRDTKEDASLVITESPSETHPYTIVSANQSNNPEETKVTLTDGTETGEIGFVVATLTQAIAQPVAAAPRQPPGRDGRDPREGRDLRGGAAPPIPTQGGGQAGGAAPSEGVVPPVPVDGSATSQSTTPALEKIDSEPRRRRVPLPGG